MKKLVIMVVVVILAGTALAGTRTMRLFQAMRKACRVECIKTHTDGACTSWLRKMARVESQVPAFIETRQDGGEFIVMSVGGMKRVEYVDAMTNACPITSIRLMQVVEFVGND